MSIKWRAALSRKMHHDRSNYLVAHERYGDPVDEILGKDNVVLFGLDRTHVFFCVTDPAANIFNTRKYPFMFPAPYLLAKKLILLPHARFHQLAERLGDPDDRNVAIVSMTARCGSTLLCQMLNNIPDTRVMSEPWTLVYLHQMVNRGLIKPEENKALVKSIVRVQLKKEVGNPNIKRVILKLPPFCSPQMQIVAKQFPRIKIVFNTRHPMASIKSWMKLTSSYQLKPLLWNSLMEMLPVPYDDPEFSDFLHKRWTWLQGDVTEEEHYFWGFAFCFRSYLQHRKDYCLAILYEDIVQHPEEAMRKLFAVLAIPEEHIPLTLEGLKHDSQNQTFGKRGNNERFTPKEKTKIKIDAALKELKVPLSIDMSMDALRNIFK